MFAETRALVAAGHTVDVAGFGPLTPSQWSRDCAEAIRVRDPRATAIGYVDDLASQLRGRDYDLLVPGGDYTLLAVSTHRDRLEPYVRLGLPAHETVVRCLDRDAFYEASKGTGLQPLPHTLCTDFSEALAVADQLGFPLFLRSAETSVTDGGRVVAGPGTIRAADAAALQAAVARCPGAFLVQGAARGQTLSFGGVIGGGRLLGACLSRYLRTWPPVDGNAAASVTLPIPASLEAAVVRTLIRLDWEGMFEIELIVDDDGRAIPIDLNPRAYGSMSLATAAGANLPAVFLAWVHGEDPAPVRARPGVRYRWEDGDLRHIAWLARSRRFAEAFAAARPRRDTTYAYFRVSDPKPFAARVLTIARDKALVAAGRRPCSQ